MSELGLVAKTVGTYKTLTYASPDYIRAHGEPFTLADLSDHIGVSYAMKSGRIRGWEFLDGNEVRTVPLKSAILVNDADTYVACGLAGLGLIQGGTFVLDAHVRSGRLNKVFFIDWLVDLYSTQMAEQS